MNQRPTHTIIFSHKEGEKFSPGVSVAFGNHQLTPNVSFGVRPSDWRVFIEI